MKNRISKKRHNSYRKRERNFRDWPKNPHFYGALAMLLPLTAIMIAYIAMGVFPFGNQATMIIDLIISMYRFSLNFMIRSGMVKVSFIHGTAVWDLIL